MEDTALLWPVAFGPSRGGLCGLWRTCAVGSVSPAHGCLRRGHILLQVSRYKITHIALSSIVHQPPLTFHIHEFIPTHTNEHAFHLIWDYLRDPSCPSPTPDGAALHTGGTRTCGHGVCSRILSEVACAKVVPYSTTSSLSPLQLHLSCSSNGHSMLDCFNSSTAFSLAHLLAGRTRIHFFLTSELSSGSVFGFRLVSPLCISVPTIHYETWVLFGCDPATLVYVHYILAQS